MFWISTSVIISCILHLVVSDGYSKEHPTVPFPLGNVADSQGQKSSSSSGTAAHGYYGGPVSMDYVSRYHGPIAVPVVLPDGTIDDTPEVSAAKSAHLAALEKAKALWYGKTSYDSGLYNQQQTASYGSIATNTITAAGYDYYGFPVSTDYVSRYHGPVAVPVVLPDGTIADTPEVSMARAAHLAALEKAKALWYGKTNYDSGVHNQQQDGPMSSYGSSIVTGTGSTAGHNHYGVPVSTDYVSRYHGPVAVPVVLPDGTIADTPEVSMARAAHLAALEKAKALWYGKTKYGSDSYNYQQPEGAKVSWAAGGNFPYHGPQATPTVLPSGYLADTPAIPAARPAHINALTKAQAESNAWQPKPWNK